MATESIDEIIWAAKERDISVDEAKQRLDAYYTRECARKVLEGQIEELSECKKLAEYSERLHAPHQVLWELEGLFDKRIAELRAAIQEMEGK